MLCANENVSDKPATEMLAMSKNLRNLGDNLRKFDTYPKYRRRRDIGASGLTRRRWRAVVSSMTGRTSKQPWSATLMPAASVNRWWRGFHFLAA
jgi:hypothetical protein